MDFTCNPYHVDVVLCVDASAHMLPVIEDVKRRSLALCHGICERMYECGRTVASLRVKLIAFRDYAAASEPMRESPFFSLPEEQAALDAYLGGIEAKEGTDGAANALEALALAMSSDWTAADQSARGRQVIALFSNAAAHPLGLRRAYAGYPDGMPADLQALSECWHVKGAIAGGTLEPRYGRLAAFAPLGENEKELTSWARVLWMDSPAGADVSEEVWSMVFDLLHGAA